MINKVTEIFGENFLWGETKNVNIEHVLKQCRAFTNQIQSNSKHAHSFILAIILYFQEFLSVKFTIPEISNKYFLFFMVNVIDELNNTNNYELSLASELSRFFDRNSVQNRSFFKHIFSFSADVFNVDICILSNLTAITSSCFFIKSDINHYKNDCIIIFKQTNQTMPGLFSLVLETSHKSIYEFSQDGDLKKKNADSSTIGFINQFHKAIITCSAEKSYFSTKKSGLFEFEINGSKEIVLNLCSEDTTHVRSNFSSFILYNRNISIPKFNLQKKEIELTFKLNKDRILIEIENMDIYREFSIELNKILEGNLKLLILLERIRLNIINNYYHKR